VPVREIAIGRASLGDQKRRLVARGRGEGRRITVRLAIEAKLIAIVGHGAVEVGDEQNRRDASQYRHGKRVPGVEFMGPHAW
jgi:hypothetical protein